MLKEKETKIISFRNHQRKIYNKNDHPKDNIIHPHQLLIILRCLIHSKNGICLIKYHPDDPEKTNTITTILSQIGNTPAVYLSNKSIKGRKYSDIKPWIIGKEIIIVDNVNNESASNVKQIARYVSKNTSKNNRILIILTKDHTLELFDPLFDKPVINFVIKK